MSVLRLSAEASQQWLFASQDLRDEYLKVSPIHNFLFVSPKVLR